MLTFLFIYHYVNNSFYLLVLIVLTFFNLVVLYIFLYLLMSIFLVVNQYNNYSIFPDWAFFKYISINNFLLVYVNIFLYISMFAIHFIYYC